MAPEGMPIASNWASAVERLAGEREELGIELFQLNASRPLAAVTAGTGQELADWLKMTASIASGIDRKTAAAYLISIFVWRFDEILATLYLQGIPMPQLKADDVAVGMFVGGQDIQFRFHFLEVEGRGLPFDRAMFRRSMLDIHRPLVEALNAQSGLSKGALWRLVADGISGGFLADGKAAGSQDRSMVEAAEVLVGHPLQNRQWSFVEVTAPACSPQWFRLRGGCCRLYLTDGGDYCTTCVLRNREDQVERLKRYMLSHRP